MTIDVEKLSEEQIKKLTLKIQDAMREIVIEAEEKANQIVNPYGMDFKMVISIGVIK